jgi:hypothetical protein
LSWPQQQGTSGWTPSVGEWAGIISTVGVLWVLSFWPFVGLDLVAEAAVYVILAWALTAYLVLLQPGAERPIAVILAVSMRGIWLAPAVVLSLARRPEFALLGFFFLMGATFWLAREFLPENRVPGRPCLAWALSASLALQSAAVAYLWHWSSMAIAFVMLASAITTITATRFGAMPPAAARSAGPGRAATSAVVAMAVTAVAMIPSFPMSGPFGFTRALLDRLGEGSGYVSVPQRFSVTRLHQPFGISGVTGSNGVPGVVLRPKRADKPAESLIISRSSLLSRAAVQDHERIPFTGEYLLFQSPLIAPPSGASMVRIGDPFELSFRTSNVLLFMEARQKLSRAVDTARCSRVDLEIRNAAIAEGDSLEMYLVDSLSGQSLRLGSAAAFSARQTLSFRVPPWPSIQRFDTIRVKFHRRSFRFQNARIAIDSMVLVPRL